ncbi:MAG: Gfo/Idh/MocA family protein [Pseudonocardiaceae bacterium]
MVRALLVGCGSHGGEVLLPAALAAGIHPVGLVDPELVRAKALAEQWGVANAYASIDDVPTVNVDAAIIALPVAHHAAYITWALNSDLHVFVEKPPATDLTQLRALADQVSTSGRVCCVGMNFRCAEGVQILCQRLASGRHGAATYVRVVQVARKPLEPFGAGLSMEASLFYAQGIHAIDLALSLAPTAKTITGQQVRVNRGRLCVIVGEDQHTGTRAEASFGSSAAGLYHQVDVFCDSGDLLSLRNLSELLYLPHGGEPDVADYPGARVLWRRSPMSVGYTAAGYTPELASFKAQTLGETSHLGSRAAVLTDLLPVYEAFDALLESWGVPWTN